MSGCTPIDVSAVSDEDFRSSSVRVRVAAGVLIDVGATVQQ
jgi:hypothetical protein